MESSVLVGRDRLSVADVMALDLEAWLVVLSACQTGLGRILGGDEIVGLTRAFIYAGTPSVISSLWPVDDLSTSVLMSELYTALCSGQDKGRALRRAQQAVRQRFPSPRSWAGFVLTGDWR